MKNAGLDTILDIGIIGAGPAALVTLFEAKQQGLQAVAIDKGPVCSALMQHPIYMRWFSTANNLELCGFPLVTTEKNPTRREYLLYCQALVRHFDLDIAPYHTVSSVQHDGALFQIHAQDRYGRACTWQARNVVLSTGFFDNPRPLNIPGEPLPKVTHYYQEAHPYADQEVLVVGAGSSAAEVALELYRAHARVTVVMRGDRFHTKYWLEPDVENRIAEGAIQCYRNAELVEIRPDDVVIQTESGAQVCIPNDFVLAMTGYVPDTSLLEQAGAQVDKEKGKPVLTEQYETTVPGLYVAGTLCAGYESNTVFIENSREHGPAIVNHIVSKKTQD